MKMHKTSLIIACILISTITSLARADLSIESVYPNVGRLGEDLDVVVQGSGFDENTRVSINLDTGNRRTIIGSADTPGSALGVAVSGTTAYIADGSDGLQIVDVADPQNPVIIGSVDTPGSAQNVAVSGTNAYVADGAYGLQIVDVAVSRNPVIIGTVNTPGSAEGVAVSGTTAYVADGEYGLRIVDVANPRKPVVIGAADTPGFAHDVAVANETVYVADGSGKLKVIDVADLQKPVIIGSVSLMVGAFLDVAVAGTIACVVDYWSGLRLIDVSDPENPVPIAAVVTGEATGVAVTGTTAYVTDKSLGVLIVDVANPRKPALIGSVDTGGYARCVAATDTTAYVASEGAGMHVIDVADIQDSNIIGSVEMIWAECVAVAGTTAYVANNYGLHVIDVANPQKPVVIGSTDKYDDHRAPIAIAVTGTNVYLDYEFFGLRIVDVADPRNPVVIGSMDMPDWVASIAVAGTKAYMACDEDGLLIVDVADPRNPVVIGSVDTPGSASDVVVMDRTAYVADDDAGLQIVDVADPRNPVFVGSMDTPNPVRGLASIDTSAHIIAYDTVLRIVDVADPRNPVIVGSVDTLNYIGGVSVTGNTAYVASSNSLHVVDVANPETPVVIGSVFIPGSPNYVTVAGQIAYVTDRFMGLKIVPVPLEIAAVELVDPERLRVTLPGPSISGHYNLRIFNRTESYELLGAVSFLEAEDYQVQREKKAVVAAGGNGDPSDRLTVPTRTCANFAYLSLLSQGYERENIRFLAPHSEMDVDGDGLLNDVDGACTSTTLSSSIAKWGADASELIVYLVDHGGEGTFFANAGEIVRAHELDGWLDTAQETVPGKVVLIYDACYSGSFLPQMSPPAGKERIVLTSSQADEPAWFMDDGALSFSYQFWASIFVNANLYESFVVAKNMMSHDQTGVLDADGDGTQTKEDVELIRAFLIGRGRVAASSPPEIGSISETQFLSETSQATVWVSNITSLNEIERVWAVIVPPDFENTADTEVTGLDTVEMEDPDGDGVYTGSYDRFVKTGAYRVTVHAQDDKGLISLPRIAEVKVNETGKEGPATLYFPFARSDGFWETEIGVVNKSTSDGIEGTFVAYDQNGTAIGYPVFVNLQPLQRKSLVVGSDFPTPEKIRYVAFEASQNHIAGYQRPRRQTQYRSAVPASFPVETDTIFVPHIASTETWWTLISLVNTGEQAKDIVARFSDGTAKTLSLDPGECRQFKTRDLFEGQPRQDIESAELENCQGVVGIELFGNGQQLGGIRLNDRLSDQIFYPTSPATTIGKPAWSPTIPRRPPAG